MSNHNHNHSCNCNHANVKYCKSCRVCHCLDCNQEWSPRSYYTPYWGGNSYLGNTILTGATGGTTVSLTSGTTMNGEGTVQANYQTAEPCKHGDKE